MGRLVVSVSQNAVIQAELAIEGCDGCVPDARIPFWQVLASFRSYSAQVAYILPVLARCPNCQGQIDETTLVQPRPNCLKSPQESL